jgi:hypothetical protein
MNYLYVTKNTQQDIDAMNGYTGTTLLHSGTSFLVWLWNNPQGNDLQAAQDDAHPSINVVAMTMINIV